MNRERFDNTAGSRLQSGRIGLSFIAAAALLLAIPLARADITHYDVRHTFNGADGATPSAMIEASDGNFYGTTRNGGSGNIGNVFRATRAGVVTTLYSFSGPDGSRPESALVEGRDGMFYGTTTQGGAEGLGTVFRITPSGSLTVLYSFPQVPGQPRTFGSYGPLMQASDGMFYGTSEHGGATRDGIQDGYVYRLSADGTTVTLLHDFARNPDGASPMGALIQASDGYLYGTTSLGSTAYDPPLDSFGVIYRLSLSGEYTVIYAFTQNLYVGGRYPFAGLVQGNDGNFYGTALEGGANDAGVIFRVTPTGVFTPLHSFNCGSDGQNPSAELRLGPDGNFYGSSESGAADPTCSSTGLGGELFRVTPDGVFTTLHIFSPDDNGGYLPNALTLTADGGIYGSAQYGIGTIFQLQVLPGRPTVTFDSASEQTAKSSDFRRQTTTAIGLSLSDSSTEPVTLPYTATASDPKRSYSVSPGSPLVIPAGRKTGRFYVQTKAPPLTEHCDQTIDLHLGTPGNATLGAITDSVLTVHNYGALAPKLCSLLGK